MKLCASAAALLFSMAAGEGSAAAADDLAARFAAKELAELAVHPPTLTLAGAEDSQRFLVQATFTDGTTGDVTTMVDVCAADPTLVGVEGARVTPRADGATALTLAWRGRSIELPVTVAAAAVTRPVSFRRDVMPVITKAGCNSGACHGSASGQDGFRMSLFGFDPDGDHFRITGQLAARRINLALPAESLLREKAIGAVPHTGGQRFAPGSELDQTLLAWLEATAPVDPPDIPRPIDLAIYPPRSVLEGAGSMQQLLVVARYSDGSDRDVTDLCAFFSSADSTAKPDSAGRVTAGQRGEAFVLARFATFTVGTPVIVLPEGLDYQRPTLPETSFVDPWVHAKLDRLRILPSSGCDDATFLRRAWLDVVGLAPPADEARRFLADPTPGKRDALIDQLLARKEFSELWVMKFAELLQMRTDDNNRVSYKATLLYFHWLEDQIARNVPFDQMVRELLSASGGTFKSPAANYYQVERDTLKVAENVAQVFLGMRIQCAQCHNHPFDRWTMDDYYGFAAFFSQVGRKQGEDPRETIIFDSRGGEVTHPVGGRVMAPKFLGGATPDVAGKDRRRVMAEWLTAADNPWFARNLVNLVWAHFFGVGIVEPVDDVRVSNPPSNPDLLDEMARRFIASNYDFKALVRAIGTSQAYQRATTENPTNALDERNFSRALPRRVRAEVLLDVISSVTETPNKFPGLPLGARAVQIADGNVSNYFLATFGRASRATVCSCEVKMEPNLSQALHLLNGDATSRRIADGQVVAKLLAQGSSAAQVVEELWLRCLARAPTATEFERVLAQLPAAFDAVALQTALEDVFWALLNAKEFAFNH